MTAPRVDAALEDARAFITHYVVLTPEQADACALWSCHTYALDAADITPYLNVSSPEKQSGKSLLLEVVGSIAHKPWFAVRPSEAVLFRKIEKDCPTLLLDEVDTIWSSQARSEDEGLRALLNAGFRRRGSTVPRCVGPSLKLRDFRTFCPKALAGIGDLPDTIADRCIPIRMERKRRGDQVARWRWRDVEPHADEVRAKLEGAVSALCADLAEKVPDLPTSSATAAKTRGSLCSPSPTPPAPSGEFERATQRGRSWPLGSKKRRSARDSSPTSASASTVRLGSPRPT